LKFVKATHQSPYGLISSEWHRDGKKFDWQIEIPANTTATVYVPDDQAKGGHDTHVLGSGKYHFTSDYTRMINK
jgi:alpha-L-rhamnosidase